MPEVTKFEFNTGRLYKANGQIIKCEHFWSDRMRSFVIAFNDISRGIPGWIVYSGSREEGRMKDAVLAAYDSMAYATGWIETRGNGE